ncbi:MAG: 2-amino-4-hydroxy-6-hydroxymethyldihydropteridine diphosphokinase [Deltaproteobacteria bacterium]|nr:2-amino-4-hydroxy-6-hydroxymethyldihydropteridine diphosphokinase [Deltaproteobacteria bacterium]
MAVQTNTFHTSVYIAFGGNLGDVLLSFHHAISELEYHGIAIELLSSAYRTQAIGVDGINASLPDYWNAVGIGVTSLNPQDLLLKLQTIETVLGRLRRNKWESRTIDLDILLYGNQCISLPNLIIPHPELKKRLFVLRPLAEISPNLLIPDIQRTVTQLIAEYPSDDIGIYECKKNWHKLCKIIK